MATAFSTLHDFIKRLVGDGESECSLYGVDLLNSQIRLSILLLNDANISENETSPTNFVLDLTNPNKLRVVLRSAINILDPLPDLFTHKSPILTITRRRGRAYVDGLIGKLEGVTGGMFAVSTDTEFQAILQSFDRWLVDFDAGLSIR